MGLAPTPADWGRLGCILISPAQPGAELTEGRAHGEKRVLDNSSVVHWIGLGRTRVHVRAPAVVPPPELLVKSQVCGPK